MSQLDERREKLNRDLDTELFDTGELHFKEYKKRHTGHASSVAELHGLQRAVVERAAEISAIIGGLVALHEVETETNGREPLNAAEAFLCGSRS